MTNATNSPFRFTVADTLRICRELYGEGAVSRGSVRSFLFSATTAKIGKEGAGPRGARLLTFDEVVGITGLLSWFASLGGPDGVAATWVRTLLILRQVTEQCLLLA